MRKSAKRALWCLFMLYCGVMLWLLFGRERTDLGLGYWENLRLNLNLVPFATIRQCAAALDKQPGSYLFIHSFVNLFGNIGMFLPFGYLLPCLWRKMQSPAWLLLCMGSAVAAVEVTQLFTLLGSCDIDDLILNELGVLLGLGIWKLHRRIRRARNN